MPTAKGKKATKKKATKKKATKKKATKKKDKTQVADDAAPKEEEVPKVEQPSYIDDAMEVHKKVLSGFKYVTDEAQYNKIEDWRIPEDCERVTGDCDDFALACGELLREKGHQPKLLFCLTETGGGHLICVLRKMALDNRQRTAVKITDLISGKQPYTLISVSGRAAGTGWFKIHSVFGNGNISATKIREA